MYLNMENLMNIFKLDASADTKRGVLMFFGDVMGGEIPAPLFSGSDVKKACEKQIAEVHEFFEEHPDAERKWRQMDWDIIEGYVTSYTEWNHLAQILSDIYWESGGKWTNEFN